MCKHDQLLRESGNTVTVTEGWTERTSEGLMEFGLGTGLYPGPPQVVFSLDSILEGILQDEDSSSSSAESSKAHLSLDNIPDALPIKDEMPDSASVDIMVSRNFGTFMTKHVRV